MKLRTKISLLLMLIALPIVAYWGYRHLQMIKTPFKPRVTVVSTAMAKVTAIPSTITALGSLSPAFQTNIVSQISGYISSIDFQEGQTVTPSTLLLRLRDTEIRAQLQADTKALLLKRDRYHRYQLAKKENVVSADALNQAEVDYQAALSAVEQDKIHLHYTSLYAPANGIMGANNLSVGQYVTAGSTLATLVDKTQFKVSYSVPERYASQLQIGQAVNVKIQNNDQSSILSGKVSFVSPSIDSSTGTVEVHAILDKTSIPLLAGQFVSVEQTIGHREEMLIPERALVASITGYVVYTITQGKAHSINVVPGKNINGQIVITSDLKPNTPVIVRGAQAVKDGQNVSVTHA